MSRPRFHTNRAPMDFIRLTPERKAVTWAGFLGFAFAIVVACFVIPALAGVAIGVWS